MTGKRAAARARTEADIMRVARSQLADVGAAALSLREIAREVGLVSSAIYRYVDSRDELLTRLIIDAYTALGRTAERASADHAGDGDLDRWVATCRAIRRWALDHPHEYLLLFGSPVPGYAAPSDTVDPGTRATLALVRIVADAAAGGRLAPTEARDTLDSDLATEFDRLATLAEVHVDADHIGAFLIAWTQLFGHISFELTNQTRGMIDSHDAFFAVACRTTGDAIGLR